MSGDVDSWASWTDAVARRGRLPVQEAEVVLREVGLHPPPAAGKPHRLRVVRVDFAGFMPRGGDIRPFSFGWDPPGTVGALATIERNEAGKSSVFEVVRWALRGRCGVQPDVRQWIRQVLVELDIDDERLCVVFGARDGEPTGGVLRLSAADSGLPGWPTPTARDASHEERPGGALLDQAESLVESEAALWVCRFTGSVSMEAVVGDLMLDRLGFNRLSGWQKMPSGRAAQQNDGVSTTLSWPLWSAALGVGSLKSVIGQEVTTAARLLQVYLGAPWAGTAVDAGGALGAAQQRRSAARRRSEQDATASAERLDALREEEQKLLGRLSGLERSSQTAEEVDRRLRAMQAAARAFAAADTVMAEAARRLEDSSRRFQSAEADLLALSEDRLTRRFFHSLTPTCCPRCDARVTAERLQREQEGRCSLCDEAFSLTIPAQDTGEESDATGAAASADLVDDLPPDEEETALRTERDNLRARREADNGAHDRAKEVRAAAQVALEAARVAFEEAASRDSHTAEVRTTETRLAVVRAFLQDKTAETSGATRIEDPKVRVLEAAEKEAKSRRDADQRDLLVQVSKQILELGRHFGLEQLEEVRLDGAARLAVTKGGAATSYMYLTPGEQLRLKIATAVALLRVGRATGIGRHPGLILIDSVGAEEMAEEDLAQMLRALQTLAGERHAPQILIFSARGRDLARILTAESLQMPPPGERLW
ncbi:putative Large ATP-binding protein [Frankia sp. AiPs1]|uniref:hypothetical protein n=1 Tax=Frankia sp. AiPa1 TaxID=573492 RepID=UPI00202B00D0|nr:hypothetical protein [Frankia sp. AiPa1]MCL9762966.1 hypothetical protein [Frankia sp. AiPa1]